ncbi:hypothetical protein MLD38_030264 [Melastoma candidum]|uniref:Uncharacterized protein n=1 Tax=Melastoma candidum TaxID=119954 RepID=A0ACB9MLR2_9MYRT|nr:hypothetical protein MLD38_030264 [Melastoma candidum]
MRRGRGFGRGWNSGSRSVTPKNPVWIRKDSKESGVDAGMDRLSNLENRPEETERYSSQSPELVTKEVPAGTKSGFGSHRHIEHVGIVNPAMSEGKHSEGDKPFDICLSRADMQIKLFPSLLVKNRERRLEMNRLAEEKILRSGMILLKKYLSIGDQVKIVRLCRDLGVGPGGFYRPGYRDGAKLHLMMMCLGKNWDPETGNYADCRSIDGAKPPRVPDELSCFVAKAIKDSHSVIFQNNKQKEVTEILPPMTPNICIVNFYSETGKLGLHQDRDESEESLRKGLPVVSFSIGDTAEFLYGDRRDISNAEKVMLESGDVLIFGGKSRHIFHGVSSIVKGSAPPSLLDESKLRPGRLNLTFREY